MSCHEVRSVVRNAIKPSNKQQHNKSIGAVSGNKRQQAIDEYMDSQRAVTRRGDPGSGSRRPSRVAWRPGRDEAVDEKNAY